MSALLIFIALGFSIGAGSGEHLVRAAGPVAGTGWLLALIPVMFTYSGWNAAAYVAEEIRDPGPQRAEGARDRHARGRRDLRPANLLFLYVLPVGELAKVQGSVLDVVADGLLGPRAGDIMAVVSIVSIAASISAMTFAGPRVYYAMARDGVFFQSAARIHPRFHTPAVSIVGQSIWSGLLVLSGGAERADHATPASRSCSSPASPCWRCSSCASASPTRPARSRRIGYPVAPAFFALASALIVANALYTDLLVPVRHGTAWGPAAAGLIVVGLGVPLYYVFKRAGRHGSAGDCARAGLVDSTRDRPSGPVGTRIDRQPPALRRQ